MLSPAEPLSLMLQSTFANRGDHYLVALLVPNYMSDAPSCTAEPGAHSSLMLQSTFANLGEQAIHHPRQEFLLLGPIVWLLYLYLISYCCFDGNL